MLLSIQTLTGRILNRGTVVPPKSDIVIKDKQQHKVADNNNINTGDGVTHICIDIDAKTELGRMLSHYYESGFVHPTFGSFKTLEGFWRYINCDDEGSKQRDDFRTISGRGVNKISRHMAKRNVKNFKQIIYEANYYRIINDKKLYDLFVSSTLPFDYYFLFGDAKIVQRAKGYSWIINMYEELRQMMKAGEKPPTPDYGNLLEALRNI